jgi:poly(3-hydroxybutyrate) depolymerase
MAIALSMLLDTDLFVYISFHSSLPLCLFSLPPSLPPSFIPSRPLLQVLMVAGTEDVFFSVQDGYSNMGQWGRHLGCPSTATEEGNPSFLPPSLLLFLSLSTISLSILLPCQIHAYSAM